MPQQLLSDENKAARREEMRTHAFGQNYHPTIVDRFGTWLSARQIRKFTGSLNRKTVGDFGCGYDATFIRTVLAELERAVLIDFALAGDLKKESKVHAIEGVLPEVL